MLRNKWGVGGIWNLYGSARICVTKVYDSTLLSFRVREGHPISIKNSNTCMSSLMPASDG